MRNVTLTTALCLALAACGGGSGGSADPTVTTTPPVVQKPYSGIGGYYTYTNSSSGSYGHLVVSPDGSFVYDQSVNGCYQYGAGQFALASDAYTINNSNAYLSPQGGCAGDSTLVVSGDFIAGSEIDMYGQDGSDVEWEWDGAVSQQSASVADLVGNYQFSDGSKLTVAQDGSLIISGFGCAVSGQVTVPDATLNVYVVTATLSNCSGEDASLEGTKAEGLFALDSNDDQIVGGISAVVNGLHVTLFGSAQLL